MRRLLLIGLLVAGLWAPLAQAEAPRRAWSADTADLLPAGRTEVGLFGAARLGLSSDVELQAHPLWFFIAPHFGAKVHLVSGDSWVVSSRHSLSYPSALLGLLSREGTGGVLPVETEVPHIINLTQDVVATLALREDQRLSFRAGLRLAVSSGDSTLPTIDVPVVYPRTAAWHEGFSAEAGISWSGRVYCAVFGGVSADLFWVPAGEDSGDSWHYALEATPNLTWRITESWALMGGAKFVWGTYPFGEQSHVLPLVDVTYGWGAVQ